MGLKTQLLLLRWRSVSRCMLYSSGDVLLEQWNMSHVAYRVRCTGWVCYSVGRAHVCSGYAVAYTNTHSPSYAILTLRNSAEVKFCPCNM